MGKAARWLRGLFGGKSSSQNGGASVGARTSKEKRRWGFVASFREREIGKQHQRKEPPPNSPPPPPLEAAVLAVERLKSRRRNAEARRKWAAMKIQAAFRGYLARRALRALKGLVKLQALVRGNIIRKQAAETLRCMQALVRVQARTRARRALGSERSRSNKSSRSCPGPPTPEKYEHPIRVNAVKSEGSFNLKRNSSNPTSSDTVDQYNQNAQSSGWNWLDRWIEERYWDGREATTTNTAIDDERNAKILEIDPGKPHFTNPKGRINNYIPQSAETDQSPVTPRFPLVEAMEFTDSPLFYSASSSRPTVSSKRGPFTPVKSDCSVGSLFSGCSDYPNYMANTESSRAKVRSQSAPKQRPDFEPAGQAKRAPGGQGVGQRSASLRTKFANRAYPGSGRLDRLGMPLRI